MKIFKILSFMMFLIMSICGSAIVFADDIPDPKKDVQSIVSIFNNKVKGNIGEGEFEVKTISANEKFTRYNIKYKLPGGKVFQYGHDFRSNPAARINITLELSSNKFSGISGLVFSYLIYNPDIGGSKDTYIVIPQNKRFTSLDFDNKMFLEFRNYDQDNDSEIIDFEGEPWSAECNWGESNIEVLFWPKAFHLDIKSGKLLDVSQQFPQVYKEELEKPHFSIETQQIIKNSIETSPECKAKYFNLLNKVQRESVEISNQSTVASKDTQVDDSLPEMLAKEFEYKYRNQHIDKLIILLGEPSRTEIVSSEIRYTWNFEDINKMPVRIVIMRKNEADCYCDEFIANINRAKGITSLWCKSNKQWLTIKELRNKESVGQKSPYDIKKTSNMPTVEVPKETYSEDLPNPMYSMDFKRQFSKSVGHLVQILGKEHLNVKKVRAGIIYVWDYNNLDEMPVKIKILDKKPQAGEGDYSNYVDQIQVFVNNNGLTKINLSDKKGWKSEDSQAILATNEVKETKEVKKNGDKQTFTAEEFRSKYVKQPVQSIQQLLGKPNKEGFSYISYHWDNFDDLPVHIKVLRKINNITYYIDSIKVNYNNKSNLITKIDISFMRKKWNVEDFEMQKIGSENKYMASNIINGLDVNKYTSLEINKFRKEIIPYSQVEGTGRVVDVRNMNTMGGEKIENGKYVVYIFVDGTQPKSVYKNNCNMQTDSDAPNLKKGDRIKFTGTFKSVEAQREGGLLSLIKGSFKK